MARDFEILNAKLNIEVDGSNAVDTLNDVFSSAKKSIDSMSKAFNESAKSFESVDSAANRAFNSMPKNAAKVDDLIIRINSLNKDTSPSISSFLDKMDSIRSGINLALSGDGIGSAAAGIRQALFGVDSSSSALAKGLDFLATRFVSTSNASNSLTADAETLSRNMRDLTDTVSTQLKDLKSLGAQYNILPSEFNSIGASVQKSRNEFQRLLNTIEATGKITPQQLAQVRNQSDLVLKHFTDLRSRGIVPLGSDLDRVLTGIENEFKSSAVAATNLTARMNAVGKSAEQASVSFKLFGVASSSIKSVASGINPINLSVKALAGTNKVVGGSFVKLKDIILGTFIGGIASNAVSSALSAIQNAIANIPTQLIALASSAEEDLNRFNAVFDTNANVASDWADNMSLSIGRSKNDIRNALTVFQSFAKGLGFSQEQSFDFSTQLESLSLDFASFNNISDKLSQDKFIAAMSGSSEVMDQFGINIKDAQVELKLIELGLANSSKEATEQQKVIARLAIIYDSLNQQGAVGDAIRTANSFTNQQKKLQGQLVDFGTAIGQQLLPALAPFLRMINDIATVAIPYLINSFSSISQSITTFATGAANVINTTLSGFVNFNSNLSIIVASAMSIFGGDWNSAWQLFSIVIYNGISSGLDVISSFLENGFDWGFSFIEQVSEGILSAVSRVLMLAINAVTNTISSFLEPGSPPEQGPLSTIDTWGSGLMKTFTSSITTDDLQKQLNKATTNVLAVRQEIIDAEKAGYVPPELKEKLKLAEEEKAAIKAQIKDQKNLNKEQAKGAKGAQASSGGCGGSSGSSGASRVGSEIKTAEQIKEDALKVLDQQYAAGLLKHSEYTKKRLEVEKKYLSDITNAGGTATQEQLDSIKKLQIDYAEQSRQESLAILEQQHTDGIIKEQDYIKEKLKIEEKYNKDLANLGSGNQDNINSIKELQVAVDGFKKNNSNIDVGSLNISDLFQNIEQSASSGGLNIGVSLSDSIKNGIDRNFNSVSSTLSEKFDSVKSEIYTSLSTTFTSAFDKVKAKISEFVSPINNFVSTIRNIFVGVIQGASFASTAIALLYKRIDALDVVFGTFRSLPKLLGNIISYLKNIEFIVSFLSKASKVFEAIVNILGPAFTFLTNAVTKVIGKLNPFTLIITAAIIGILTNIDLLTKIFDDLKVRYSDAFSGITSGISKLFSLFNSGNGFSFFGAIINQVMVILNEFVDILSSVDPVISGIFSGIFKVLSGIEKVAILPILDSIGAFLNLLAGDSKEFEKLMLSAFTNIKSGIADIISGAIDIIYSAFSSVPQVVGEILKSIFTIVGLESVGDSIKSYLLSYFEEIKAGLYIVRDLLINILSGQLSIQSIFNSFGLNKLGDFLSKNLSESFTRLSSIFNNLSNTINTKLLPVFSKVFAIISTIVTNSIKLISDRLSSLQPILDYINILLNKLGFGGAGGFKLLEAVVVGAVGVIIGIITLLAGVLVGLIDGFSSMIESIIVGVGQLSSGIDTQINAVIIIFKGLLDFWSNIFSGNFVGAIDNIKDSFDGLKMFFSGGIEIIIGLFNILPGSVIGLVSGFTESVIGFFTDMYNELIGHSIIPDMITGILNSFSLFDTDLGKLISATVENVLGFFINLGDKIVSNITTSLSNAGGTISGLISGLFSGSGGTAEQATPQPTAVDTSGAATVSTTISQLLPIVTNSVTVLQNLLNNFILGTLELLDSVGNKITATFLTTQEILVGENSILVDISDSVIAIITNMAVGVVSQLKIMANDGATALTSSKWSDVGKYLVLGIIKGINDNRSAFIEKVKHLAQEAISAAEEELGISSPSIAFREIGAQVVDGFSIGVATLPDVIGGSIGMARDVAEKQLKAVLDPVKIKPILSTATANFRKYFDQIKAIYNSNLNKIEKGKQISKILMQNIDLGALGINGGVQGAAVSSAINRLVSETFADIPILIEQSKDQARAGLAAISNQMEEISTRFRTSTENVRYQTNSTRNAIEDAFDTPITDAKLFDLFTQVQNGVDFGGDLNDKIKLAYLSQNKLNGALEDQLKVEEQIQQIGEAQAELDRIVPPPPPEIPVSDLEAGLELLDALNLGLDATVPDVLLTLSNLSTDMIEQLRQNLQISSPSKVLMKIGNNVGEGLKLGIINSTKNISQLGTTAVNNLQNSINSAIINPNNNGLVLDTGAANSQNTVININNKIDNKMDLAYVEQKILNTIKREIRK